MAAFLRGMVWAGLGGGLILAACAERLPPQPLQTAAFLARPLPMPSGPPVIGPWGYPLEAIDRSVDPGDDFFAFANGTWLTENDIPSDRTGIGFSQIMRDRNETRIASVIDELVAADSLDKGPEQQIRDLYISFMDVEALNAAGLEPTRDDLAMLAGLVDHQGVAEVMANPALGLPGPFRLSIQIDSRIPTQYAVWAGHGGLGLPDRTYYLRDSQRLVETRVAYEAHIEKMLTLAGLSETKNRAAAVFALERAIAEQHWSRVERRNADKTYNPMTLADLGAEAPGFPWEEFILKSGYDPAREFVVREASAFAPLAALFAATPVAVWRDYLTFHYLANNAGFLSETLDEENFNFFGKTLRGQSAQREREKRAIALVNQRLNQAVGKIYIERFFPEDAKRQMEDMFENIRIALSLRIRDLDWMTPDTKIAAQRKLAHMTAKIGYPEVWRDYSGLTIQPDDLLGNIKRARLEAHSNDLARLAVPVDTGEWFTGPQTVNAFYSPTRNEAFIPAGYIQSPLFDPNADPAINYGAIGSIIGHEIGHGFDDQGSKYDADGTLRNWWTDADREAFDALGDRLAAQFDTYEVLPGLNVNGRQTLGENIGDLAGVTVAYHAYNLSLKGETPPVLDGFTGPQRVFLGRAQARRYKRTEESLRQRLLSAPHSPMSLRVNGMVRNIDEWYEAFDVQPNDALYLRPEERVKIW